MDTLKIAYKILYNLEHKKPSAYLGTMIGPAKLGVPEEKWLEVIRSLLDEQYIAGITIQEDILGHQMVDIENARITLKGAEYLHENSAMAKLGQLAANVIDIAKP